MQIYGFAFVSALGYYVNFMHQILPNWQILALSQPGKLTKRQRNLLCWCKSFCIKVPYELTVISKVLILSVLRCSLVVGWLQALELVL